MRNLILLFAIFLLTPASLIAQSTASEQVISFTIEAPQLDKRKKSGCIYQDLTMTQKIHIRFSICMMLKIYLMPRLPMQENGR